MTCTQLFFDESRPVPARQWQQVAVPMGKPSNYRKRQQNAAACFDSQTADAIIPRPTAHNITNERRWNGWVWMAAVACSPQKGLSNAPHHGNAYQGLQIAACGNVCSCKTPPHSRLADTRQGQSAGAGQAPLQ